MNTPSNPAATTPSARRPWVNRRTLVAFVAGAALAGGVAALASEAPMHLGG
jgi:hypothetical protein